MAKKSIITIASIAAGIILVLVVLAIAPHRDKGPDFTGKSPEEIKAYFRSDAFQKMNERDQRAVKIRAYGPMKQQQEQVFIEQAKTYSKLPPKQKIRYLDERIDELVRSAEQKQQGAKPNHSGGASGAGAKDTSPNSNKGSTTQKPPASEGIRAWSETMDPEKRAIILELKEAMSQRMKERGIDLSGK